MYGSSAFPESQSVLNAVNLFFPTEFAEIAELTQERTIPSPKLHPKTKRTHKSVRKQSLHGCMTVRAFVFNMGALGAEYFAEDITDGENNIR